MKTGYDQHFKKIKQGVVPQGQDARKKIRVSRSSRKTQPRRAFPVAPLISFLFIAGGGLFLLTQFENIESFLQKIEISMGVAQAAEAKTPEAEKAKEGEKTTESVGTGDQKTLHVDAKKADDSDYLFKLAERKKQLDQREEELNKVAAQIEKQKAEIAEKLNQLEETRQKISAALAERIKADDGKVDVLVQMYTNMKPAQAAKVFESLDEDLVIEILSRMKKKNAADILNLIKPDKAQIFAERYTGYRAPANSSQ